MPFEHFRADKNEWSRGETRTFEARVIDGGHAAVGVRVLLVRGGKGIVSDGYTDGDGGVHLSDSESLSTGEYTYWGNWGVDSERVTIRIVEAPPPPPPPPAPPPTPTYTVTQPLPPPSSDQGLPSEPAYTPVVAPPPAYTPPPEPTYQPTVEAPPPEQTVEGVPSTPPERELNPWEKFRAWLRAMNILA